MRRTLSTALLCVAVGAAGCGAAPSAGSSVTMAGTLVLKGNEPRVTPVLVRSDSEQWELLDVAPAQARALQNRPVEATGTVVRAATHGPSLPALRVSALRGS